MIRVRVFFPFSCSPISPSFLSPQVQVLIFYSHSPFKGALTAAAVASKANVVLVSLRIKMNDPSLVTEYASGGGGGGGGGSTNPPPNNSSLSLGNQLSNANGGAVSGVASCS